MMGGSTTDCGTVSSAPSPGQRRRPRRLPWQRSRESRGPAGTRADGSSLLNYHTEAEVGGADEVRGTSARGGHGDRAGGGCPSGARAPPATPGPAVPAPPPRPRGAPVLLPPPLGPPL